MLKIYWLRFNLLTVFRVLYGMDGQKNNMHFDALIIGAGFSASLYYKVNMLIFKRTKESIKRLFWTK